MIKILNKRSVHEIELLLDNAVAEKKEEMMSIQKMQGALDQVEGQVKELEAEIARLENNAKAQSAEKLKLEKTVAGYQNQQKNRELDIIEKKNKESNKIDKSELVLKKQTVALEREQLLFGSGNSKEVKNNI